METPNPLAQGPPVRPPPGPALAPRHAAWAALGAGACGPWAARGQANGATRGGTGRSHGDTAAHHAGLSKAIHPKATAQCSMSLLHRGIRAVGPWEVQGQLQFAPTHVWGAGKPPLLSAPSMEWGSLDSPEVAPSSWPAAASPSLRMCLSSVASRSSRVPPVPSMALPQKIPGAPAMEQSWDMLRRALLAKKRGEAAGQCWHGEPKPVPADPQQHLRGCSPGPKPRLLHPPPPCVGGTQPCHTKGL